MVVQSANDVTELIKLLNMQMKELSEKTLIRKCFKLDKDYLKNLFFQYSVKNEEGIEIMYFYQFIKALNKFTEKFKL